MFDQNTSLAPQKAADVNGADPTRDTYQRKVLFDGTNFFIVYWDLGDRQVKYVASSDGETWTSPIVLWTFGVGPYYGGNIDIQYPNRGEKSLYGNPYDLVMAFCGSNGNTWNVSPFNIIGQVLSAVAGGSQDGSSGAQGGSIIAGLVSEEEYWVYHSPPSLKIGYWATQRKTTTAISYGGTTTGGAQILTYKTATPFYNFVLAKDASDKLWCNRTNPSCSDFLDSWTEIATLTVGFSDFCACSEAQAVDDPERIHIVYIKSTGELCYRKFENDILGSEEIILVASGASYPVIATGANGELYVFYVKDGKIYIIQYNNSWSSPVEFFTAEHTYDNPTYLSCSQNIQNDKICLVWCEGPSSPYEVWFSYIMEGEEEEGASGEGLVWVS